MNQNLESEITGPQPLDANEPFPTDHRAIDADPQNYAGDILNAMREPTLRPANCKQELH